MKNTLRFLFSFYCVISTLTAQSQTSPYRQWIRAETHDKLALVIGNSAYANGRLPGARSDADLMAKTLLEQGYDVMLDADLNQSEMIELITDFSTKTSSYKSYLVYYAGHAFELNGINYLVPLDAQEVIRNCISLDEDILSRIADPTKPKLVILDACRTAFRGNIPEEKEQVWRRKNTKIIYSTVSRTRVRDDNPFVEEFTKAINQGGCIDDILLRVTRAVDIINSFQVVNSEGSLLENICFKPMSNKSQFSFIEGGSFLMGDIFGDGREDEKPVHMVSLSSFLLSKTEVTNADFVNFLNEIGYQKALIDEGYIMEGENIGFEREGISFYVKNGQEQYPVVGVSWYCAVDYCNWLSERDGYSKVYNIENKNITLDLNSDGYRLPFEAEWEFAARNRGGNYKWAGTSNEDELSNFANISGVKDGYLNIAPVGSLRPNQLGLFDMTGNVDEWVWNTSAPTFFNPFSDFGYSSKDLQNAYDIHTQWSDLRVIRGGNWTGEPSHARSANRSHDMPSFGFPKRGFRLARNAQ